MTDTTIRKSIYIKATPDQVWPWLTDPDKLGIWFHKPKVAMAQGARLEMYGTTSGDLMIWGKVQVMRAPEYLEYTFTIKPMGDVVSVVKWTLEPVDGGTRLSLEHSGLPTGAEAFGLVLALDKGWDGHIDQMRTGIHGDGK
jgi:uncharacterized protein YndB with AHSA1/START domain